MVQKKNAILITVDCLRADHLGCMGYPKMTTTHLDNLAAQGVVFSSAFAVGPVTPVSFLSIFTSTYPLMHEGYTLISDERTALAEVLTEHGYHTAAFHSNPYLSRFYHYDRGFQTFYDSIEFGTRKQSTTVKLIKKNKRIFNVLKKAYTALKGKEQPHATADEINKKVLSWVRNCSDEFFLWIHYMDVHAPYVPPPQYMEEPVSKNEIEYLFEKLVFHQDELSERDLEKIISLYDAEIRYVDHAIKSLLDGIGEEILKNTLVVISSDHGDEFGEHGGFLHGPKLYDELLHVPLILCGPGLKKAVVTEPVSLLDLAPTILDFLNIENPQNFQGKSLLPLINKKMKESGIISEVSHKKGEKVNFDPEKRQISYRTSKWKYIYRKNGVCELYNLESDPLETKNVLEHEVEKAEEFRSKILEHIKMEDTFRRITRCEEMKIDKGIEKLKLLDRI